MKTVILISEIQIKTNTPLGGNIDISKILPAIKTAQNTNIREILGNELYDKLQDDYEAGTISGDYETLLYDYVQPMIIHLSTANYLTYGAYSVSNKGVYKASSNTATSLTKEEIDYVVKSQLKLYKSYKGQFYDNIQKLDIPEYLENEISKNRVNIGNWSLKKNNKNCK